MIEFQVKHLDRITAAFQRYPQVSKPLFARAINALLAELHKHATDEYFLFKAPRALRTGRLSSSFAEGINLANPSNLQGSIGPRVRYAIFVHEGTSRGIIPNPFMVRILKASEPKGEEYFAQPTREILEQVVTA